MEYSRKVPLGGVTENAATSTEFRVMDFGTAFLIAQSKGQGGDATSVPSAGSQEVGYNVAELLVSRGLANVVPHRDFEERSNYYDALLAAEAKARASKKGIHGGSSPSNHIQDLTTVSNGLFCSVPFMTFMPFKWGTPVAYLLFASCISFLLLHFS